MAKIIYEEGDIVRYHMPDGKVGTGVVIGEKSVMVVAPSASRDETPKVFHWVISPSLMEIISPEDRNGLEPIVKVAINAALAAVGRLPVL